MMPIYSAFDICSANSSSVAHCEQFLITEIEQTNQQSSPHRWASREYPPFLLSDQEEYRGRYFLLQEVPVFIGLSYFSHRSGGLGVGLSLIASMPSGVRHVVFYVICVVFRGARAYCFMSLFLRHEIRT